MEWIPITNKPPILGKYLCFVPTNKYYNKHWAEYRWNGENFIDDDYLGKNRIVQASHYMIVEEPESNKLVEEHINKYVDDMVSFILNIKHEKKDN